MGMTYPTLNLESLNQNIPTITEGLAVFYKENCMICLENQGHSTGVLIGIQYGNEIARFEIIWDGTVTQRMRNAYGDLRRATDNAACAFALMIVRELTDFTGVQQSAIGSTIDYYLVPNNREDTLIFNRAARLEVSGILCETATNTVENRMREKQRRLQPEDGFEDYIVVVAFSAPRAKMVKS